MIKISIIMPVYNKEKYLRDTIDAILRQDYENFELITVDDGSTDDSEIICSEYANKDDRVKVYHIENGGVSNARNIGIRYATGDYIQFIDADDTINQNTFNKYIEVLRDKDYDVIFSSYNKVDHNQRILDRVNLNYKGDINKSNIIANFAENQFNTGYYGWISNKLIKRKLIKKNNIEFDKSIVLAEDLDFFIKVYTYSESFYFINYYTFNYLQEAENSSFFQLKIDYYTQLLIHLRIKYFIEYNNNYNNDNRKILEQRIRDYIFYAVFYEELNREKIEIMVNKLYGNKKIAESLVLEYKPTFRNFIVFLISKNRIKEVYILLKIRNTAKKIVKNIIGE
ncbi:glycosyltransferase family 2 protein [Terrisporobacter glycolicus]|uniref:glycosyltransferase family 2 protein n=1 Tax=Terrisporobacter petrolearius TaxID=1460447 RepID=UPI0011DCC1AC